MVENENTSKPIKEEILTYYKELKLGSPKAMALMDCIREVDLSILIEGDQAFVDQEHEIRQKSINQTKLNRHVAQISLRRETIFDRIQTIEGYALESEKANDFVSQLRSSVAGQSDPMDMNVSNDVTEFFTMQVIHPMLGVKTDVTAP